MKPKRFILCFEAHRKDQRVWSVRTGRQWFCAETVALNVPVQTVYLGLQHRQPRAYLAGVGIVRAVPERITITAR